MPTAYEIMLGGNLTDVDRQKILAQQLRNRRQTGELSMLSGDKVLQPLGQNVYNDALDKEVTSLNVKDREVQDTENTRRFGLNQAMEARQQTETERHNRAMEQKETAATLRLQLAENRAFDQDVRRLSEKMVSLKIPELKSDMDSVDAMMDKYSGQDIPGVGATGWLPNFLKSADGSDLTQRIAAVRNKLLQARSGAAVTDPETNRLIEELGSMTDRELILAWPKVRQALEVVENTVLSGYDPEVVSAFQERFNNRGSPDTTVARSPGGRTSGSLEISFSDWK